MTGQGGQMCRQAMTLHSRSRAQRQNRKPASAALLATALLLLLTPGKGGEEDAVHVTAALGESVVFNCPVEFPGDQPVPFELQWKKKGMDTIYIWNESYPTQTQSGEGYEGRLSRVNPDSAYGAASLNLTNIRASDQGWYECKVVLPNQNNNGTWFYLDVQAPAHSSVTPAPDNVMYVNLGDAVILNCQAEGTPMQELLWYKDASPVDPSATIDVSNNGTLRISPIRPENTGNYTCTARNGSHSHTTRVIIAGGAVITVPPTNQTKLEGEKAQFSCEANAQPGNVTVKWFREGAPVREVAALQTRVTIHKDGSLVVSPVSADDSGQYLCEVSNGIGQPQSASAYLNVEYPAKVTCTPTIQHLPFHLAGVVQCHIKANPPLQYVTWTKDKRLLEPSQTQDIVVMNNGSLLFTRVNQDHQGRYTCTPYNAQGTQGSSGPMEVLVQEPHQKVGDAVDMHCDSQGAEGVAEVLPHKVNTTPPNEVFQPSPEGPKPGPPRNLTVTEISDGFLITWQAPVERSHLIQYYTIKYRTDGPWRTLNKGQIRPEETSYLVKNLVRGRTYYFRVLANSVTSYESSDEVKFPVPARVTDINK